MHGCTEEVLLLTTVRCPFVLYSTPFLCSFSLPYISVPFSVLLVFCCWQLLVLGGGGFVGAAVCEAAAALGAPQSRQPEQVSKVLYGSPISFKPQ